MRIIALDDSKEVLDAFQALMEVLYPRCELCLTDNLPDFHEILFESGTAPEFYDKIIIDAQLIMPNGFSEEYYNQFLKELEIYEKYVENPDMLGWWYCDEYLRKRMPSRLQDIAIKTGFARTIQDIVGKKPEKQITILYKGDPDYEIKLKTFLNR